MTLVQIACATALVTPLALSLAAPAAAQAPAGPIPTPVVQIIREEVRPGRELVNEQVAAAWAQTFARHKWQTSYIGMTSVAGPGEAWYVIGYPSYQAVEQDRATFGANAALMADVQRLVPQGTNVIESPRTVLARLRPELSHKLEVELPSQRYLRVTTYRLRPGHVPTFEQHRRLMLEAYRKAGLPAQLAVYQVNAGLPGPAFLVFTTMRSLGEMDPDTAMSRRIGEALGEENQRLLAKLAGEAFLNVETQVLAFNPRMSHVSAQFAAADPTFWRPSARVTAQPAPATRAVASKTSGSGKP